MSAAHTPRELMKEIINGMCAGNASMATDAILDEFVVIRRSELPEAEPNSFGDTQVDGIAFAKATGAEPARRNGLRYLALAEHLEAREAEQAATDAQRDKRRDELALEFTSDKRGSLTSACNYGGLLPWTQAIVDRLIDAEERIAELQAAK